MCRVTCPGCRPCFFEQLVRLYKAHVRFEEDEFLPLCETILGRNSNHMVVLGLSLHLRHAPPVAGHI